MKGKAESASIARRPIIGITLGDPAGIGPELVLKFFAAPRRPGGADFLVIGEPRYLLREAALLKIPIKIESGSPHASRRRGVIPVYSEGFPGGRLVKPREISAAAGRASKNYIHAAVDLALKKSIDAVVTCPIHKESLHRAGSPFPGHTELIAHQCGVSQVALMLVHEKLRIVHLSNHVSLREACNLVNRRRIRDRIRLIHRAGRSLGMVRPRIAVAGLNPHAGEQGLFGREELQHIIPAIRAARRENLDVHGPFPADSMFPMCAAGEFDFALAMYHDQGHIALKLLGFQWNRSLGGWSRVRGVNVSLGLPIIRTSVDHGVAFDIAGKGRASAASLRDAVAVALQLIGSQRRDGG